MSENFKYQLSVKIDGQHLLNLRTETVEEFNAQLKWAVENAEQLQLACTALQGPEKPQPVRQPVAAGARPASRPPGGEIGPIVLENVEIKRSGKDGTVWKNPMFIVKYDGTSASTFDPLIGKAAQGFWTNGSPCYLTVEPSPKNPRYLNVASIRSAVVS